MINLSNSRSLTDFQRNARSFLDALNQDHEPLLLTVNGQIQAVVIDPQTFHAFEEFLEQERFVASLQEGLDDLDEGLTESLEEVQKQIKARYGV